MRNLPLLPAIRILVALALSCGPICARSRMAAYLILYRIVDGGVEIVRVVHAARNLDDLV